MGGGRFFAQQRGLGLGPYFDRLFNGVRVQHRGLLSDQGHFRPHQRRARYIRRPHLTLVERYGHRDLLPCLICLLVLHVQEQSSLPCTFTHISNETVGRKHWSSERKVVSQGER